MKGKTYILFWEESADPETRGAIVHEMFEVFMPHEGMDDHSFISMVVLAHSPSKTALKGIARKLNKMEGLETCADAIAAYKQLTSGE